MNIIDSKSPEKCQVSPIRFVPGEWDEKTLLDAAGMKKDLIVAGPFGSNLKVSDYRDEGIPIIRLQNIDYGKFIDKEIKYISPEKARELAYHSFRAGDLVLAKLGEPIGKTCIVPDYFQDGVVVADVVRIRVANGLADKKFIMYSLNSVATKNQLINGTIGSTRPRVNLDQIRDIRISVPPLNEQRKIAAILTSVDAVIEQTDTIIAQTERMKKGLMQELFTKGNDEWPSYKLEELTGIVTKGTTPTTYGYHFTNSGINFIKIESLSDQGDLISENLAHIDEETNFALRRSILQENDILFSIAGALGRVYVVTRDVLPANTNQALSIIRINNDSTILVNYLKYFLMGPSIRHVIKSIYSQSAQSNLSLEQVRNFLIKVPPLLEQKKVIAILSTIDANLSIEKEFRIRLDRIKNGLMQDLLTGRIRVKVDGHA
jgi:type I restriction enzyme S subunit